MANVDEDIQKSAIPSNDWTAVAALQHEKEVAARFIWSLPMKEFRSIPYVAPPLPKNVPKADIDVLISEMAITNRDGYEINLRLYRPCEPYPDAAMFLNIHGGGWVVGSPQTEEAQNRSIAAERRVTVVSVDYRRAPEFAFPCGLNDCYDALLWCKDNSKFLGINKEKIIIGGGSAGANLTACLVHRCIQEGIIGIIGQILNIPVTCHPKHFPRSEYPYTSYEQNNKAPIVSAERILWFWDKYLPDARPDPDANPLLAPSMAGLPPTLIQVAGMDPLRDEGLAYASRLEKAGVKVTLKLYRGVPHAFYIYPQLPQSEEYLRTMLQWLNQFQT